MSFRMLPLPHYTLQSMWQIWSYSCWWDGLRKNAAMHCTCLDSSASRALWMQTCTKASTGGHPWESGEKLEKGISEMVGKWKDQSLYSWSGKIYFQKELWFFFLFFFFFFKLETEPSNSLLIFICNTLFLLHIIVHMGILLSVTRS